MPVFKRKQPKQQEGQSPWQPVVDMNTAKPVVLTLAKTQMLNDAEKRAAIRAMARLSDRPPVEKIQAVFRDDPRVFERPWRWLLAVMQAAADSGDYHLAVAALFWCCHWTADLIPVIGKRNVGAYLELELDPITPDLKREILAVGVASARQLPEDTIIFDDGKDQVWVADIAEASPGLLGV